MKLGILLVGLGLVVCTFAYGIDHEESGVLNPAAEPSAPTRKRRPHTGALPSNIPTPITTKAKNSTVEPSHSQEAVTTSLPVALVPGHHDQQFGPSETDEAVVPPVYSQSSYQIQLQPFALDERSQQQHGSSSSYDSGSVAGPPPLALPGTGESSPAPLPSLPPRPSYSSPHPPSPASHTVIAHQSSSYDVPEAPAVPPHRHQPTVYQPVSLPAYHTSWSAPTVHTSSSFSSYGHQQQQEDYNRGQSSDKDEDSDDSGEHDGGKDEHSGGAFSISFTAPGYAPIPYPQVHAYQLPQTTVRPIYQAPTTVVPQPPRQEPPKVPQYEPPRSSGFPQYQVPQVSTPQPHFQVPSAPALQPQYSPPIPPATLPQYEPVRNPSHRDSSTPSYQVIVVEAEPANAAYPAPAPPTTIEEIYPDDLSAIPGKPGQDYPQMAKVPQSTFNCGDKLPGYYADLDSQCQVWHFCDMSGRRESFLCPNGTLYNQEKFVCDWWYNVDCGLATSFFRLNEDLYKVPVRTPVVQYQAVVQQQQGQYQQQEQHQGQYQQQEHQQGHHQQEQQRGHHQQVLQQHEHHQQEQQRGHHQQVLQQQGHYQQQEEQRGHHQQQEEQRGHHQQQVPQRGHYQQQQHEQQGHYHQQEQQRQFESVSSGHDSSSGYGHGSQQTGVHVSSYSLTQEHPTYVSSAPQVVISKQQPQTTQTTPSYVSQSSTVATPVRVVETKQSPAPTYGQIISSPKPLQEESESHGQSTY